MKLINGFWSVLWVLALTYRETVKAKQKHKGTTVKMLYYLDSITTNLAKSLQISIVLHSENKGKYGGSCQIVLSLMFSNFFLWNVSSLLKLS